MLSSEGWAGASAPPQAPGGLQRRRPPIGRACPPFACGPGAAALDLWLGREADDGFDRDDLREAPSLSPLGARPWSPVCLLRAMPAAWRRAGVSSCAAPSKTQWRAARPWGVEARVCAFAPDVVATPGRGRCRPRSQHGALAPRTGHWPRLSEWAVQYSRKKRRGSFCVRDGSPNTRVLRSSRS